MTNFPALLVIAATVQLSVIGICHAQTKTAQNTLQPPPDSIKIDGNAKEWGDSLRFYDEKSKINYAIANDNDNLYVAVRIGDRTDQVRVLHAGLTLSIDTRGRKKETFALTFPLAEQGGPDITGGDLQEAGDLNQQDRDELLQARMTKLREIRVVGFKDIEGDIITTSNTYGIKAAIDYDADNYLVYEAAIPLKFFHADDAVKTAWEFNLKINGIIHQHPAGGDDSSGDQQVGGRRGGGGGFGGGGGRGGHGGGGRGGQHGGGGYGNVDHSELAKSTDFWEKFYLAK